MTFPRVTISALCLMLALTLPVWANNVYVGNKPYQGQVMGAGPGVLLVLSELGQALRMEVAQTEEGWTLGGVPVETKLEQNEVWVPIKSLPKDRVRVIVSSELNTVDIYASEIPGGPTDGWGADGTMVYFYADWSPACRAMENTIQALERASTIKVVRLNIHDTASPAYRKYTKMFEGDKIPFFVLLDKRGRKIESFSNFHNYNELLAKLKKAYPK